MHYRVCLVVQNPAFLKVAGCQMVSAGVLAVRPVWQLDSAYLRGQHARKQMETQASEPSLQDGLAAILLKGRASCSHFPA